MISKASPAEIDRARYDRLVGQVHVLLARLNEAIGGGATFGYLGNLDTCFGDDRSWYVFLPHPGRAGTSADRLGGFGTGDAAGVKALVAQLCGALTMAEYLANRR